MKTQENLQLAPKIIVSHTECSITLNDGRIFEMFCFTEGNGCLCFTRKTFPNEILAGDIVVLEGVPRRFTVIVACDEMLSLVDSNGHAFLTRRAMVQRAWREGLLLFEHC